MAVRVRVRSRDRGARKILRQAEQLARGRKLTVGIHREDGAIIHDEKSMKSVAQIAAIHEFGDGHQPPRPFLRASIDNNQARVERGLATAAQDVLRGKPIETALQAVGDDAAEAVRAGFDWYLPSLDPKTVELKGHSRVLEETGQLKGLIKAKVGGPKRAAPRRRGAKRSALGRLGGFLRGLVGGGGGRRRG